MSVSTAVSEGRLARANAVEARVKVAHMAALAESGRIVTVGLGSCVAITLWDKARRVGALAHVLLPEPVPGAVVENPAKFATTAVPALEEAMRACGSRGPYVATLTGGASLFGQLLKMRGENVGGRNTAAAQAALERANIPVVGSDTGGDYGRTVTLDVADGSVTVRSVARGTRVL